MPDVPDLPGTLCCTGVNVTLQKARDAKVLGASLEGRVLLHVADAQVRTQAGVMRPAACSQPSA